MKKRDRLGWLKQRFEGSALLECWAHAKKNRLLFLLTMLYDVLFIASLSLVNFLLSRIMPEPQAMLGSAAKTVAAVSLALLVYLAVVIFLYSLAKFKVMGCIAKIFSSKDRSKPAAGFNSFLLMNLAVLGAFSVVFLFFSMIFVTLVRIDALALVRDVFYTVFVIFAYFALNTAHSLFAQGSSIKGSIKGMLALILSRPKSYLGIVSFTIVAFFALAGAYYAFDWLLLLLIRPAFSNPAVFMGYAAFSTVLVALFALGLLAFNRLYFYSVVLRVPAAKAR